MNMNWNTMDDFLADPSIRDVIDVIGSPPLLEPASAPLVPVISTPVIQPEKIARQILDQPFTLADRDSVIRWIEAAIPLVKDATGNYVVADAPRAAQVTPDVAKGLLLGDLAPAALAAQALANHAQSLDQIKPLDNTNAKGCGYEPLIPLIRRSIQRIAAEFRTGSPIPQAVEAELKALCGCDANFPDDAACIGGYLKDLGERAGLAPAAACSIDDEKTFTNYTTLVALTRMFVSVWKDASDDGKFFTTALRDLYRRFFAIINCLERLRALVPASDWITTEVATTPPILARDLWKWMREYAGVTAPQMLKEGGRDALCAVNATMREFSGAFEKLFKPHRAAKDSQKPSYSSSSGYCQGVPGAFDTKEVQDVVHELLCHTQRVIEATDETS